MCIYLSTILYDHMCYLMCSSAVLCPKTEIIKSPYKSQLCICIEAAFSNKNLNVVSGTCTVAISEYRPRVVNGMRSFIRPIIHVYNLHVLVTLFCSPPSCSIALVSNANRQHSQKEPVPLCSSWLHAVGGARKPCSSIISQL